MLLNVYGHYIPREMRGFSNSLSADDRARPDQAVIPVRYSELPAIIDIIRPRVQVRPRGTLGAPVRPENPFLPRFR